MTGLLLQILREIWEILKEAGIFLLVGYLLAGLLAVLVPKGLFTRLLGTGKVKSVFWASVIGIPLPLCSCGALPTALGLRRQGATSGATVAFLVATPETGVDSISLSYALTDPILTIVRPLAGIATAIVAGLATNLFGERRARTQEPAAHHHDPHEILHAPTVDAHGDGESDHDHSHHDHGHHDHDHSHHEHASEAVGLASLRTKAGLGAAAIRIGRYGFRELLDETSHWLVLGIVLSGIVAALLPPEFVERNLGGGLGSMLWMLLLSIPVYTCASSSTPLAAALVMKGLSPGAALVFLLAGPATNLGSVVVLAKFLGVRVIGIYLAVVAGMTLLAGWALDLGYRWAGINARATFGTAGDIVPEPVKIAGALILVALLVVSMWRTRAPREWIWLREQVFAATGLRITGQRLGYAALAIAGALYLGSGVFQVGVGEIGVKERFGRVVAPALRPGLHVRLPWPIETDRIVRMDAVRRIGFGFARPPPPRAEATRAAIGNVASYGGNAAPEASPGGGLWFQRDTSADAFLLTGDVNLVDLRSIVQYRIKSALNSLYAVADAEALVRSTALAALRGVVATYGIDALYTTAHEPVEQQVAERVQAALDRYGSGIAVVSVRLLYVHPPDAVHDAFRDVASAQEDKLRTINRAGIFAVEKVNQAKADAAAMLEQALAAKDLDIMHAKGDAAAFALRLAAYRVAPELTRFRLQLETLTAVLPGVTKLVRPGADAVKDFDLWLLQPPAAGGK